MGVTCAADTEGRKHSNITLRPHPHIHQDMNENIMFLPWCWNPRKWIFWSLAGCRHGNSPSNTEASDSFWKSADGIKSQISLFEKKSMQDGINSGENILYKDLLLRFLFG